MTRTATLLITGAATLAILGAAAVGHPGHAPIADPKVNFDTRSVVVPFDLFRGSRIIVGGSINGTATDMMLDSGAGITVVDTALADKLGLKGGIATQVRGAGGDLPGRFVSGVSLSVGALQLTNLSVLVLDMAPIARGVGREIPVVLGQEAFKAGVVAIDFPHRMIRFSAREGFRAPADAVRLDVANKQGLPATKLSVAGLPEVDAHLDLGSGGTIVLAKDYWSSQPTLAALRHAESQIGGVGGMKLARRVMLPEVAFGGIRFANVPATLNDDPSALPNTGGNIGIDLLKSFVVTFDSAGGAVYLEGRGAARVFDRERAGIRTELAGDRLNVVYVSPDGPAAAAGLKTGDAVIAIDGAKVDAKFYDRPDWTRGAAGQTVKLMRADGSEVAVKLTDYF